VIINATGEFWQFTHKDIRAKSNITFGREIFKGIDPAIGK